MSRKWNHVGFNINTETDRCEVYVDGVLAKHASLWHPIRITIDGKHMRLKVGMKFLMEDDDDSE